MRYVIAILILVSTVFIVILLHSREIQENSLFENSESDNMERVKFLIAHGANLNEVNKNVFGFTPLIVAIYHENIGVANYLIDSGANVNLADKWGVTPLMHAVLLGDREIALVEHLIDRGAIITTKDNNGDTVFSYAKPNTKMLSVLKNAEINGKNTDLKSGSSTLIELDVPKRPFWLLNSGGRQYAGFNSRRLA
jgi:hypothetical protein